MEKIFIAFYAFNLLLIFLYAISQLNMLINYFSKKNKNESKEQFDFSNPEEIPKVTIQLPLYNEMYVVERLLDGIAKIRYPKDKLEIQVLDDSTDESVEITAKKIQELQERGLDIQHIRRVDRVGFKAGALKEGLKTAKGEFVAIFDADFLPKADFLEKTIPPFKEEKVGVVQTRWGHINRDYSILTKIQAFALDIHFTLEQVGRNKKGHIINFNGTAGVWRKSCIMDAGNWQGDTLTEDLDLSYRAQLKGWKFVYLESVISPAELPVTVSAAKSQQFRWNKGGAENFQKMKWNIFKAKGISFKTKIHSLLHLMNSTLFLNIFMVALLSVPLNYIRVNNPELGVYFEVLGIFAISTILFLTCYWFMYQKIHREKKFKIWHYGVEFLSFFTIALGFTLHNALAVIEGHIGKKSAFIRTPKFNINTQNQDWQGNKYLKNSFSVSNVIELFLIFYFAFGIYLGINLESYGLLFFHLMLVIGYSYVLIRSIFHEDAFSFKKIYRSWCIRKAKIKEKRLLKYITKNDKTLDVITGNGAVAHIFTQNGYDISTVDYDNRSAFATVNPLQYVGNKMPYENKSFDVVMLITALHHIDDYENVLKECIRIGKKVIVMEDIYENKFQKYLTFIADSINNWEFFGHPHNNHDDRTWQNIFQKNNCEIAHSEEYDFLYFFKQKTYILSPKDA
jgi:cellulose synthase/poly-beta-1,6-N-acetylglucosamine synthase-like glycosyltransferase/SAM-dependent methyltransferase